MQKKHPELPEAGNIGLCADVPVVWQHLRKERMYATTEGQF